MDFDYSELYEYPAYSRGYGTPRVYETQATGIIGGISLGLLSILMIYMIVVWIFRSIGLYHMAKSRGIAHAWFAWIPILSNYILGRLINNKVVLGDNIVLPHAEFFLPFLAFLSLCGLGLGPYGTIITGAIWVYEISAYWRLFKIYRPKNRVSYTIWSAILGSGFFVFAIRDDKPFDPLEPNKIYQNFYGRKEVITDRYNELENSLRNQEEEQRASLRNDFNTRMSQPDLTSAEKQEIKDEYRQDRAELRNTVNFIERQEKIQESNEIEDLESSMHPEMSPQPVEEPLVSDEEVSQMRERIMDQTPAESEIIEEEIILITPSEGESLKDAMDNLANTPVPKESTEIFRDEPLEEDAQEIEDFETTEDFDNNLSRISDEIYSVMEKDEKN